MDVRDILSLKGKVILITGGAGLYGQPMFEALAEAGGTVITASRSPDSAREAVEKLKSRGFDVHVMCVDQATHVVN